MSLVWVYLTMVIGGVILEVVLSKAYNRITGDSLHKKHFSLGRYIFLLLFPVIGTMLIYQLRGVSVIKIFLIFAIAGPLLEWLVGFSYHQIVGVHLWIYRKFTVNGHTSLLTCPFWGMAGVLFWLISQKFV